jgi:putative ABC transport system permease protein
MLLFIRLAIRNVLARPGISLINAAGFALGIATVLYLALFVRHETGYDRFFTDSDRIYRIISEYHQKDHSFSSGYSWHPVAADMKNDIPGIKDFCRVLPPMNIKAKVGDRDVILEELMLTDDNFFEFFGIEFLSGDPNEALAASDRIVLTRSTAERLFGKEDPVGQMVESREMIFTVSGVVADLPSNTHLKFDALGSIKYIEQEVANVFLGWGGGASFLSYIKLEPNIKINTIEQAVPGFLDEKINRLWEGSGFEMKARLQNIAEVHFTVSPDHFDSKDNRSVGSIMAISGIGLFILLLAIFNYVTLYTSQHVSRTKGLALMKLHGAKKSTVIIHNFIETIFLTLFSSVIALVILSVALPDLNTYLNASISLTGNIAVTLVFILSLTILLAAIITLISSFRIRRVVISEAVKGGMSFNPRSGLITNLLVTFQFVVVILLITGSILIRKQHSFLLTRKLGFNSENVMTVSFGESMDMADAIRFRNELGRIPGIVSTSFTSQMVGTGLTMNGYRLEGHEQHTMIHVIFADAWFLECFGIELLEGRNFDNTVDNDMTSILINRKLAELSGWDDPLEKTIFRNDNLRVTGVVEDFNFAPLLVDVKPLIIMKNPSSEGMGYNMLNVRYSTDDVGQLAGMIGSAWNDNFNGIPYEIGFLDEILSNNYSIFVALERIINSFTVFAIIIACLGLFGYTLIISGSRTKEIGIRKVNGAMIWQILLLLNRDFIKWVLVAFAVSAPIAWFAAKRGMEYFVYRTDLSWWVFALSGIIALTVSLLTVSWQSWQAARRNPVEALRYE